MCLPGMCVRLVREEGEGEREGKGKEEREREVTCELQVDWMYAEVLYV